MWTRRILVCLLLLWARQADAQVTFESITSADHGSSTSFTQAHTIGACTNCEILIAVTASDPALGVSAVAWNTSESATQLCTAANDETAGVLFHRSAPTTGTHNVAITLSSSAIAIRVMVASFAGVSGVGAGVCDAYTSSAATSQAHNISGATSGMGVDFFELTTEAGTISTNAGQTTRTGPTSDGTRNRTASTKAGATTMNMGYTWDSGFYRWVQMGVGLSPVSGGGPCLSTLLGVGKCG